MRTSRIRPRSAPRERSGLRALLSLHYFAFFAAMGAYFPYMPAWMQERGFSGLQIGVIGALLPTMAVLAPPLLGVLADALALRGCLMWTSALGATLSLGGLALYSGVALEVSYPLLFACVFGFTLCRNPVSQLADVIALENPGDYGRVRVFGSIGFMFTAPIVGRFVPLSPAWMLPASCAAALCVVTWAASSLPRRSTPASVPVLGEARRLLAHRQFRWLLLASAVGQAAHAAYDLCVSLHLRELGASGTVIGAAWAIATAGEVLVLTFSAALFRRMSSASWLVLALLSGAVRFTSLALLSDLDVILLLQPLHGLTFGLRWVCCLELVRRAATPSTMATAQGLFLGAFSLGGATSMLVWGDLFERIGGSGIFSLAAGLALLSALLALPLRRPLPDASDRASDVRAP